MLDFDLSKKTVCSKEPLDVQKAIPVSAIPNVPVLENPMITELPKTRKTRTKAVDKSAEKVAEKPAVKEKVSNLPQVAYDVHLTFDANLMYDKNRQQAIRELFSAHGGSLQQIQFRNGKANIFGELQSDQPKPKFMETTWPQFYSEAQRYRPTLASVSRHRRTPIT